MATASIEYQDNLSVKDLEKFVKDAGFKSLGEKGNEKESKKDFKLIMIFTVLGIILMYISMGHMLNIPVPESLNMGISPKSYTIVLLSLTTLFLIFGRDIIQNGIKNIWHKMPNMDSLVGIGVIVNYGYSLYNSILVFRGNLHAIHNLYFEASAMIILFVKIGRYIDTKNKAKAVDTIKNLVTITPQNGVILKDGKEKRVTINEIKKGDIVICKPGEKIAVDGVIIKGNTHTDESFITGESNPVSKKMGDKVIAGSINYDGYIEYEAEKIGKDSSISNIVQMVVEATNTKAPIARLADKISGYFVPAIFIIAILSFALNFIIKQNITTAILALVSVLVVACPCALGLATPLAMVVSIGRCSKKGILVKSSEILEAISKIDTIVFDKTGTLTLGKLQVVDMVGDEENFKILQSLEAKSNHPIAKSIVANASQIYDVYDFEEIAGMGIKGQINGKNYFAGNNKFLKSKNIENIFQKEEEEYSKKGESIVYLFTDSKVLSIVGLADEIKLNMKEVINNLHKKGKKVVMLTGDNNETARVIADKLQITEVVSNVSPQEKLEKIKELNQNKNCLMVGDGINDSPALKAATVGVSVQNGTDISNDASDVILLNENMETVCELFNIGNKTIKIIKENLFWALFYNVCMIPLATGLFQLSINPMFASLAMTLSSFTVVINSLRLI